MTILEQAIAEEIYLELKESKTPLTIGELSKTLNLAESIVSDTINNMPDKYPICQENEKYYVPKCCPIAWIATFLIMCVVAEIFVRWI